MPLDPATVLQRVLLLERQQGFQDRAAVGGLTAFAQGQTSRADHAGVRAAAAVLSGYTTADRHHRERAVAAALDVLLTGVAPKAERQHSRGTQADQAAAAVAEPVAQSPPSPKPSASRPRLKVVRSPQDLDKPITTLKGIGPGNARAYNAVGITIVRDLLYYFPRMHYDYTDTSSIGRMRVGEPTTLIGTVQAVRLNRARKGFTILTVIVADNTGTIAVRWFNQHYLAQRFRAGARVAITGEPDIYNGYPVFQPRDYELIEEDELTHAARLVPVYPLTKGLYQRSLRQLIHAVVDEFASVVEDPLPPDLRRDLHLPTVGEAIAAYHFPEDEEQKAWAQQRLAFDELLLVQLGLVQRKREWQSPVPDVAIPVDLATTDAFARSLPFTLTAAQTRVVAEILEDMARPVAMSRLLEGDVGSGKTVVAAAALLQTARAGRQGMLMAPTEILAEQHFRTLSALLAPFDVRCDLLIGSTTKKERGKIYEAAQRGEIDVLVGTHALIQDEVEMARLGLAITDEQHRFGVEQRAMLRQKGLHPHILAMTATPIPRTLAMTIYGDLDVSVIDEMPPGRLPVITTWSRSPREAYGVVRDEVQNGRQAFVICPVIEESADSDMRSVMAEHRELQEKVFPDLKVGLLHGKMRPAEKDRTLSDFRNGAYHILVATSVVEVGIDIPNATVMVIRDAHRFGLAQLHQFRGRVGRGGDQAFCVLLSDAQGDDARERLEALTATENGFKLAEADLRLRGPGEFWGTRQSGLPTLRVAGLGDIATIELARHAALEIVAADEDLSSPEHGALRREVQRFWDSAADLS